MDGPWHIDIPCWQHWSAAVGGMSRDVGNSRLGGCRIYNNTAAQNDALAWDVALTAGTWKLTVISDTNTPFCIGTVTLDSTTVGTIDFYSAGNTLNVVQSITGITVAADGNYRLKIAANTKNPSSGGYYFALNHLIMRRTA